MSREGLSYRFSRAIVRKPGNSVAHGLRDADRGDPDVGEYLRQHDCYVEALRDAGLEVHSLPALEAFPDSVFVEDTALCLPEGIIILRPGAASRRDEAEAMAADCAALGLETLRLDSGTIDGGDILVTDREILVGASERTNRAGFDALNAILSGWNYSARLVHTPREVLHFKSDCSVLGANTVLASPRLSGDPSFEGFRVIETPPGEEAAANAIRVNDTVLVAAGYPRTAEKLSAAGLSVKPIPASQAALLDGGLSCQSLRF